MPVTGIIIAILLSVFAAIRPFKMGKFPINLATGSVLSLAVLLIFQIIDTETIRLGILGNNQLKPWEIIVIFFTVAYVSISVDVTGILDYMAYKIVQKTKGNGTKLFFFFYLFACVLTIFTSNDIVILTLTPIIFYLGKHAKLNVIPLLFAEFFGANTLSMLLYIGNPTNIIVGNALGLGFLEYTTIMWIPTITAALANLLLLYWIFRKKLTRTFKTNKNTHFSVRNWYDAILSSFLLLAMLATLTLSQYLQIPIWKITSIFAVIFMLEDFFFAWYYSVQHRLLPEIKQDKDKREILDVLGIPEKKHEWWISIKRIPWKILPFITTFFILVAGLNQYGAVDWLATLISQTSTTLAGSIVSHGLLGFFLANIINNQPMTILMSNVLVSDSLNISPIAFQGGAYAVVIASNLGANLTLIGALAGLMWKKILQAKGITISYIDFLKTGLIITPLVLAITLTVLYGVIA
jgi:arsenical pump membrane protein